MVTVAEDGSANGLRRRKLHGGSGVSPLGGSDHVTDLHHERARWYSATLGTWILQDPLRYIYGADTYHFVGDGPLPYGRGSVIRGRSASDRWVQATRGPNARGIMGRECWVRTKCAHPTQDYGRLEWLHYNTGQSGMGQSLQVSGANAIIHRVVRGVIYAASLSLPF